jgi:hypothetical protein
MTVRRVALGALVISSLVIAAAYASAFLPGGAPGWAPWAMVLGNAAMPVAIMVLGAARRRGGVGRLAVPFAFTFLLLAGGFGVVLLLPPADPTGSALILGLPPAAAVILYGIGLAPLFVLPLAYAWTFDEVTLSEDDLQRVRAAVLRGGGEGEEVAGIRARGTASKATVSGPEL